MANVDTARGLRLVGRVGGGMPTTRKCFIPSTDAAAVGIGSPVKLAGSASTTGISAPTVARASAGDALFGVVTSVNQFDEVAIGSQNLYRTHRPASTAMYVTVCDDPMAVYEVQEDAVGGALAATDVGANADLVMGSVDTTSGFDDVQLDSSTKNTTATLVLKILGFVDRPDNEIGANAKVLVKINNHQLGSHTGTAGV